MIIKMKKKFPQFATKFCRIGLIEEKQKLLNEHSFLIEERILIAICNILYI